MIPRIRSNVLAITAAMVKELRDRTGLGMMDCKKALVEADGNMELAIEELRKKSVLKAAKKSGRITANGLLGLKLSEDLSRAAIVEINIETDFAAKNEKNSVNDFRKKYPAGSLQAQSFFVESNQAPSP